MVFIKEVKKTKEKQLFLQKCMNKLIDALVSKRRLMREPDTKKWQEEFSQLLEEKNKAQITLILDWYIENLSNKNMPKCYSASSFRVHFDILRKIRRDQKAEEKGKMIILPDTYIVYEYVSDLQWHFVSKQETLETIQISLKNYKYITRRLSDVYEETIQLRLEGKPARFHYVLEYLLMVMQHSSISFVDGWMREIHKDLHDWSSRNGLLKDWAISLDSRRFNMMMYAFVGKWGNKPGDWDLIKEML